MEPGEYYSMLTRNGIQLPQNLSGYQGYNQVNSNPFFGGRLPFGAGSALNSIFGTQMWPLMNPNSQSSMYDSAWQRSRDMQMMNLASSTVASWYPLKNLGGINQNSFLSQMATRMVSDPDGIVAKFMSPFLGGNPIQAQMSSFANLQGIGAAALGTGRGVSPNQLNNALDAFNSYYYKHGDSASGGTNLSANTIRAMGEEFSRSLKNTASDVARAGSTAVRGMDYSNNLGFSVNTLLTARDEMIKNRLFAPTAGINGLNALSALAGGADGGRLPSLIAAAKGLWGNGISDKELMGNLSDLIGTNSFNVANPNDTTKVENLLRMFKSTARESNINLNDMLSMVSQAQGLAGQNPNLKGLGGLDITRAIMNATQQTSVLATDGSAQNNLTLRLQGGTMGLLRNMSQNIIDAASNPSIQAMAGVRTYIKESLGDNTPAGRAMLNSYDNWAAGNAGSRNQIGFMSWMQNNFAGTSLSSSRAWQYAYGNSIAAGQAYNDSPGLLSNIINGSQLDSLKMRVLQRYDRAGVARLNYYINSNQIDALQLDPILNSDAAAGPNSIHAMIGRAANAGVFAAQTIKNNPFFKQSNINEQAAIKTGAYLDQQIDKKMGAMRPDALTRLAQSFASGDYSTEGVLKPFLKAIGVSPDGQSLTQMTSLTANLTKLSGAKTVGDVLADMGSMSTDDQAKVANMSALAQKYNLTAEQVRGIANGDSLSKYINPSDMPNASDGAKLIAASKAFNGVSGTQDYNGVLTLAGLKDFAKGNMTKAALQSVWDSRGIGVDFGRMVTGELNVMGHGNAFNRSLVNAITGMSWDGKKHDYLQGLTAITKMTTDQTVDAGNGQATLPPSMVKFLNSMKDSHGVFAAGSLPPSLIAQLSGGHAGYMYGKAQADAIASSVDTLVQNNPFLSGLTKQASAVQDAHDNFVGASGAKDLPTMVSDILGKLDGLTSIADAIDKLTSAINTK